uniref:Threonylcarbamoyladenosine tRNA methylthiotransferase n=2 Tax=Schistocephalus solidus TaxID=70667 RepID=A0A0V0J187_SCHSO
MDIEEIDIGHTSPLRVQDTVNPRFRKQKLQTACEDPSGDNIPGVQKIFVQVWGCAHNTSDAEYMAGLLAAYGYDVTLGGAENEEEEQQQQKVIGINRPKVHHPAVGDSAADCESGCTEGGACCQKQPSQRIPTVTSKASAREAADLWLLNSCTVKGPAEDHFRNAVLEAKAKGKRVVVAGCVPQGSPTAKYLKDVSVIGVQQIDRVVEVVEQTLLGNTVRFMEKRIDENDPKHRRLGGAPLSLPKIRRNPLIEILAISTGCLNACTYCKTKHARGVLASYPITELVQRAQEAFADGVKEVWLTSEDLGAYGRDLSRSEFPPKIVSSVVASQWPNHLTLADLLINLVPVIPVGCMLRLGMTNPPYILDQLNEIAAVLRHPRVYTFLHVPVQSGSNRVLGAMRREYTVEEFSHVVDFLTKNVNFANPKHKLTIATDLICGFPNETEPDFRETVGLVERYKFPVLYVNQFFARPGTPAATMKREATTAEVKKRTRLLHDFFRSYRPYAGREGLQYRVLITETSTDGLHWVGHTKAYEQILLPKEVDLRGLIVLAEVTECDKFFMRGRVVDRGPFNSLLEGPEAEALDIALPEVPLQVRSRKSAAASRPQNASFSPPTAKAASLSSWNAKLLVPTLVIVLLSLLWIATRCTKFPLGPYSL